MDRCDAAGLGSARSGLAGTARQRTLRLGRVRRVSAGSARCVRVRSGLVRLGRPGAARLSSVWSGLGWQAWPVCACQGVARRGRQRMARLAEAGTGMARQAELGPSCFGPTGCDKAWRGLAGMAMTVAGLNELWINEKPPGVGTGRLERNQAGAWGSNRSGYVAVPVLSHLWPGGKRGAPMTKSYFHEVPKLHPVDKQAALVTSNGVRYKPRKKIFHKHMAWRDVPLPTFPYPRVGAVLEPGFRVGRLVVVGYGGAGSTCARWVVRCDCGAYGHQKHRWLTSEAAKARAMCPACDHMAELKAGNVCGQP